jgi:AsmA protein
MFFRRNMRRVGEGGVKLIKIAGLGLAGLLVVAVLALVVGVPAQPLVAYVSGRAAQAGYELRVDGPSTVSLGPSLNIAAQDVRLLDAKDAEEFLVAKDVRAELSLLSLLTGDIRISELRLGQPVGRLTSGRRSGASGRPSNPAAAGEGATRIVTIDRLVVDDGTLILRDVREKLEGRIGAIQLTASIPARGPVEVEAEGKAGEQSLRVTAKASSVSQIVEGRPTPVEARLELPGLLKEPLSLTGSLKAADQIFSIDGVRGTLGAGRVNGSIAVDTAGARPNVNAGLVLDRLEFATPDRGSRNEPWSDRPIEFGVLRLFNATVKISARELIAGNVHLTPAEIEARLLGGLMSITVSRSEMYGGPIQGKLVIDADPRGPRHGASFELSNVSARPLLTDALGLDHLEGRLRLKFDLTAAGTSPSAIVASLGGTAEFSLEDGAVRDVNLANMVRALANRMLQGWQLASQEKTDLTLVGASFRVANGQATTDDLRLLGPLVRIMGKGTVNLAAQTLDLRVDPKLVLSLQGQGGPPDPAGLGVPVAIRGPWAEPRIYPDIAGILDNPEAAFAKLKAMGGALFGLLDSQPGGGTKKPKPEDVIKSLDQVIRGDRDQQSETKNQVRDIIRDLLGR